MSYINLMEQLTLAEQEETVKLLCNMCGTPGSFDWLMYISEVSYALHQPGSIVDLQSTIQCSKILDCILTNPLIDSLIFKSD